MKITLLTDLSGRIICAMHRPGNSNERVNNATEIRRTSEQQVHEVDVPAELSKHLLEGTLVNEIFKYKVEGAGNGAKLVRASAD